MLNYVHGQARSPGEYFSLTSAVSHGYYRPANRQGPFAMIIAFLLHCSQLSISQADKILGKRV